MDASSYGDCQPEEVRGVQPHGADVMLFVKKYMSDSSPVRVICLIPASARKSLQAAFQQPVGNDAKRPIAAKCKQNITSLEAGNYHC